MRRGRPSPAVWATLAVILFSTVSEARAASDFDVIDYRRLIMRTMGEQAAALGMALQQRAPLKNAVLHARMLALSAETALKAFEPHVLGGEARPEIWSNWQDFTGRLKKLAKGARALAEAGERQGLDAMNANAMSVLNCKSCHDTYTFRRGR